ncbi:MAG: DUF3068 domain-containing protein [Aeromicrobium sp.]
MLVFLGAFLIIAAVLAKVYADDRVAKTPLDVDVTTHLAGEATLSGETFPVKVTSVTKADSDKSDDEVVVFKTSSCVVKDEGDVGDCVSSDDPDDRLISASTDDFAADRKDGLAVNDAKYLPADAVPHEGLVNKFPFGSEKTTYPYWNDTVGDAVDAVFDRTEELQGLDTYVYKVSITDAPIDVSEGVPGLYSDEIEIFVEPVTGAVVNQTSDQQRTLTDGAPVLSLQYGFTDDQIVDSVDEAASNKTKLDLLNEVVPIVGYAVGIPALLIGFVLLWLARGDKTATPSRRRRTADRQSEELTPTS